MTQTRAMTSTVRRSSWLEPGPKVWLLLALVALSGALGVAVSQYLQGRDERAIHANGDVVDAKVHSINGQYFLRSQSRMSPLQVELKATPPGKGEVDLSGQLSVRLGESLSVGDTIRVRVDRTNPRLWTDQLEPLAWGRRMALSVALGTLALPMLLGASWARMSVLKTWGQGQFVRGRVARIESSAVAPLSKQLTLTLNGGEVVKAVWPQKLGPISVGDEIDLIAREGQARALVARRYLES